MIQKNDILDIIRRQITDVLPHLNQIEIGPEQSLRDLGADSIDRAEIIQLSMRTLKIKVPLIECAGITNIAGLIDLFYNNIQSQILSGEGVHS